MQASKRFLWLNCIYPAPFRMRSTIKTYFSESCDPDLSVALHCHFVSLFSFQGAIFQPLLKSDMKSQSLEISYPASMLSGGPEWARTTDLTIISRTL